MGGHFLCLAVTGGGLGVTFSIYAGGGDIHIEHAFYTCGMAKNREVTI